MFKVEILHFNLLFKFKSKEVVCKNEIKRKLVNNLSPG